MSATCRRLRETIDSSLFRGTWRNPARGTSTSPSSRRVEFKESPPWRIAVDNRRQRMRCIETSRSKSETYNEDATSTLSYRSTHAWTTYWHLKANSRK
ncbi:hypothetical protein ACS0PU_005558 [Formica fusca]